MILTITSKYKTCWENQLMMKHYTSMVHNYFLFRSTVYGRYAYILVLIVIELVSGTFKVSTEKPSTKLYWNFSIQPACHPLCALI